MADENQMDQGPAVPPQAGEKAVRGVTHAREAAEDLRSAADAMTDEYRGHAEGVWDDVQPSRPQSSGRQQAICPREPDDSGLYGARHRFPARFDFPSLRTIARSKMPSGRW